MNLRRRGNYNSISSLEFRAVFECPKQNIKGHILSPVIALKVGVVEVVKVRAVTWVVIAVVSQLSNDCQMNFDQKDEKRMVEEKAWSQSYTFKEKAFHRMHGDPTPC